MTKFTKEQIEKLNKMLEHQKKYAEYVCEECKKRFIGMDAMGNHATEAHHYTFSQPGRKGLIGVL